VDELGRPRGRTPDRELEGIHDERGASPVANLAGGVPPGTLGGERTRRPTFTVGDGWERLLAKEVIL